MDKADECVKSLLKHFSSLVAGSRYPAVDDGARTAGGAREGADRTRPDDLVEVVAAKVASESKRLCGIITELQSKAVLGDLEALNRDVVSFDEKRASRVRTCVRSTDRSADNPSIFSAS